MRHRLARLVPSDVSLHNDADVMLAAYLAWGPAMAHHVHGEFSLTVWDSRSHRLHVVRDHLGQRGCFVHDGPRYFIAASELAQVLAFTDVSR